MIHGQEDKNRIPTFFEFLNEKEKEAWNIYLIHSYPNVPFNLFSEEIIGMFINIVRKSILMEMQEIKRGKRKEIC